MSNRADLSTMFESSVRGTVNLIKRQVIQVENAGDELDPYHVAVSFRPFFIPCFPCGRFGAESNIASSEHLPCWRLCRESVPLQPSQKIHRCSMYPTP